MEGFAAMSNLARRVEFVGYMHSRGREGANLPNRGMQTIGRAVVRSAPHAAGYYLHDEYDLPDVNYEVPDFDTSTMPGTDFDAGGFVGPSLPAWEAPAVESSWYDGINWGGIATTVGNVLSPIVTPIATAWGTTAVINGVKTASAHGTVTPQDIANQTSRQDFLAANQGKLTSSAKMMIGLGVGAIIVVALLSNKKKGKR